MKNVSLSQALVLIACLVAPVVAFKLLGSTEAVMATSGIGMIINFLLGRDSAPGLPKADQ